MYIEFLRKIPLFAELPDEELDLLCQMLQEVRLTAGQILFNEGDTADRAYLIYQGELEIVKHIDGREIIIDVHTKPGIVIGEMALIDETTRLATVRARSDCFLLALEHSQVQKLLNKSSRAAQVMLYTMTRRWRGMEAHIRHNEQMAQLGTLTAGLAHELNNPAAAVMRGAGQLPSLVDNAEQSRVALERMVLSAGQQACIEELARRVRQTAASPLAIDPVTCSDREYVLESWLEEHAVSGGWEMAPALVRLDVKVGELDQLAEIFSAGQIPLLLQWLAAGYNAQMLLMEIFQGAGRITGIVKALKSYVYLDQAPVQNIDVHVGLENTLLILAKKLSAGIRLHKEYAAHLPQIVAYGSELNQVWTNIIDNAILALNGQGDITIRTRQEKNELVVEIEDSGPGIPETNLPKIFDPFFTTRPPGQGTGLGLNTTYNIVNKHKGQIVVTSQPGQTIFQVRLPAV
jgi:signal transduction histidine kinase